MILYGDLYVMFNLAMDFVLLLLTAWVRRSEIRLWRVGLGAFVGAAFAFGSVYGAWSGGWFVGAKVLTIISMLIVAFRWQGWKVLLGHGGVFLLTSFLLAGGIQGVWQLFDFNPELVSVGVLATVLVGGPLVFVIRQMLTGLRRRAVVGRYCMSVEIRLEGVTRAMTGFMDTGNHLYEPMTGLPVVIGQLSTWMETLPSEVIEAIRDGDLTRISTLPIARKLRIVPYRSVGTGTQWLIGIRPEWLRVGNRECTEFILALQGESIHKSGAYEVILHPELL